MKKQRGTILFSNLTDFPMFQGKKTDKYELTLLLDEEQATDAENDGLIVKEKEYQGNKQVTAKFKTKFRLKPKAFVDRFKKPFVDEESNIREVPRGSDVFVFYTQRSITMPSGVVVTNDLQGIQVIEEQTGITFEDFDSDLEIETDGQVDF